MDEHIHKGHRQRMKEKLNHHGCRVFDTYELLEMLLYRSVVQKDTNPMAKHLLATFGSLEGVLSATEDELCAVPGIGKSTASLIVSTGKALGYAMSADDTRPTFENYSRLGEFFVEMIGAEDKSVVAMMTLDNAMRMISCGIIYELDYSSAGVKPMAFVDRAVKNGASVAVIAHSHPYGFICASEGDRQTNLLIEDALSGIGVVLAEHYIVSGGRYFGFMTKNLRYALEQRPALESFWASKEDACRG